MQSFRYFSTRYTGTMTLISGQFSGSCTMVFVLLSGKFQFQPFRR